ncbi:helix-turn-helix domain-containing protein [Microbispora triticiradicis]|uniref:Helix-turn-helix domain-containing protein n=3 Tax=Microbispora TaxID=2005 RepID=A0ABY3M3A7_9ACTN|nr:MULTISPECIES: helix-turn-helix transcriptional regulator [Microbispora]GLW24026.1 transcriptional regulator [Microbispora amethystogenes]MBO4274271.1 helix-turn-helix domain-containing protein [Microbispora triticiradicis]RGA01172.1 XRE family transcriptional regulator [Microbispora triticiradicis]TLP56148.1 helix-turn-helix domain-containing protein [Microbispora fusca]TYB65517.1 helix-turn-helix domain-containing protein [Microbispora tritici]
MIQIQAGSGPTALRILLGSQLRKLRESKGISRDEAGRCIRASESKISRMELGRVGFKERDVADLLVLYGVEDDETRDVVMNLVDQANEPGWWHRFNDLLPSWFQAYVGLEEAAERIRTYEVQFVPGLLQTKEYARAVITAGAVGAAPEEIARRVDLRLERQRILDGGNAPTFWAVIDEAALRRPIGGGEVMRGQVQHLIDLMNQPNITIQVIPFSYGGHAAEGGAFSILRFSDQDLPDVVYVEQLASALYLDKREEVDRYTEVMERLCAVSTTPAETVDLLRQIMTEL